MDHLYEEGSNAECNDALCCRADSGTAWFKNSKAGKWGDFRCDLPMRTGKKVVEVAKKLG